jgi:nucleoside-diphosphate-sugar epimerase
MRSIAILGANGKVGMEVCLFLSVMEGIRVIPVCRSELGSAYLRRCGLDCRIGSVADPDRAGALLADCDLVADFTLPGGYLADVRKSVRSIVTGSIDHAPPGVPFVYISSTMAFGMPSPATAYGQFVVARSPYAAGKRRAERIARVYGLVRSRPVYVLRLGQVHGELQGISRALLDLATPEPVLLRGSEMHSDAVFCSTIALALRNIAHGLESPGTYTLIEVPEWSWRRVHEFYARQRGFQATIVPLAEKPRRESARALAGRMVRSVTSRAVRFLGEYKPVLTAQLMPPLREVEQRVKGRWLARRALEEIRATAALSESLPAHRDGPVPGNRLPSLSNTGPAMEDAARKVRALLAEKLLPESHNFH